MAQGTQVVVGDYVLLSNNRRGLVQFHGKTRFSIGYWYGIQLIDSTITRHNGMVLNKRYFTCPANKGLFVRRECIKKVMNQHQINNPIKLSQHKKKKKRIPKYRLLQKERRKLKTFAMIAAEKRINHKSISIEYQQENKENVYDGIPIERVVNAALSDNESIEISSDEAEMHLNAIVIERNLINHGDNEYRDIFIDNFVNDMNDIEYSISVSHGYDDGLDFCNINDANINLMVNQYERQQSNMINIHDANDHYNDDNHIFPLESPSQIEIRYEEAYNQNHFPIEGDGEELNSGKHQLLNQKQIKYLLFKHGVIPCIVYAIINVLIVAGIYLFFDQYGIKEKYWNLNMNINHLFGTNWPNLPWIMLIDLLITTIIESISIWFFIASFVNKDLRKGKIMGLHRSFDIDKCNFCIFCIVKIMRNGLKSSREQISFCHRCGRNIVSTFMCLIFSFIVFYIPMVFILFDFVNNESIENLDYIHIMLFKAGYGGFIALILSPLTAFLTLTSNAMSRIAIQYDPS